MLLKPWASATSRIKDPGHSPMGATPGVTLPEDSKLKESIVEERVLPSQIKLERTWRLGSQLGEGGFAKVFLAEDESGDPAVVKLVPKETGTDREMLFVELDGVPNVMPILDSGESDGYWVLVMPRAEKSLRDYLNETSGLSTNEAISVLTNIAEALVAVEARDVVHRDIKPENILLLDGRWHVADFGIARYADATTAPDTLKHAKTAPYAAPEQWREERATSATDVYALGIIAHELLASERPFGGPDYRHQHLQEPPPTITGIPDRLQSLVIECLYKSPGARPRPENLLTRLKDSFKPTSPAGSRLQQANALAVERQAEASRQRSAAQSEAERRYALYTDAELALQNTLAMLDRRIKDDAPSVDASPSTSLNRWELNAGSMWLDLLKGVELGRDQSLPFEVIAHTSISVRGPTERSEYLGRSHSLWYCDAQEQGVFRWYETAFKETFRGGGPFDPFAMPPESSDASFALSPTMHTHQIAWPFMPIDQGDEEGFIERWIGWFVDAAQGQLSSNSRMSEPDPHGSWRRGR